MSEYKVKEIKEFAAHLSTMGAYVQAPKPQIVGLSKTQAIGSKDAKSLYPTIMVLLNIGYDTLRGRIYESRIVLNAFNMLKKVHAMQDEGEEVMDLALTNFRGALKNLAKGYTEREKMKQSKAEFIKFTVDFYGEAFRKIVNYNRSFENILSPQTDEDYYMLKSCLYPLFEALTWISP
jgi:DNA polymerase elongation subunit (family B)